MPVVPPDVSPASLDNSDPPSNRATALALSFTNQQLLAGLTSRNCDFSKFRPDGRDMQVYDGDGTPLVTSLRNWRASGFGLRYVGRIAMPAGNSPTRGPYVQCEAVICEDLGIPNPPHTVYAYATQAGNPDGKSEGGLVCLDATGATAFQWFSPSHDGVNSLDVGDVDGDGVNELLVGTGRVDRTMYVVKASAQAGAPNSYVWGFTHPIGNSYIRAAHAGKYRTDLAGNQVVVSGSQGTDTNPLGGALGKISLLDNTGALKWTQSLNPSVVNHTIQDCQVYDLDGSGTYWVYCTQSTSLWKLNILDGSTASGWPYTHDGNRNYYSLHAGYITSKTERQIAAVGAFPDGTSYLGLLTVVDKNGAIVWDRALPFHTYGVRCVDIDGDGYDEIVVASGTDTGAASGGNNFKPPNQGWGIVFIFDRFGNELAAAGITCAAKTIAYGSFDASGQRYVQVSGDDGWLTRLAVDPGQSATIKAIIPAVAWKEVRSVSFGSSGAANIPPEGDRYFDFSGADGSAPAGYTQQIGAWTMQGGRVASPDDGDTSTGATLEATGLSTEGFEWEFSCYKPAMGTGTSSYYNGGRWRCTNWVGGRPDGYAFQHNQSGTASIFRTASGSATPAYTLASVAIPASGFVASDKVGYRLVVMGDWHALYYRKTDAGGWLELINVLDVNAGKTRAAGSIAFMSQRGQTRISESSLWTFRNADGNAGPGPVPLLYSTFVPATIPPENPPSSAARLLESGAYRLLESGAFRLLELGSPAGLSPHRLLESGASRLLESGAFRLLEDGAPAAPSPHRLLESGASRLLESGAFRLLETGSPAGRLVGRRLLESGAARLLEDGAFRLLEGSRVLAPGTIAAYPDPFGAITITAITVDVG